MRQIVLAIAIALSLALTNVSSAFAASEHSTTKSQSCRPKWMPADQYILADPSMATRIRSSPKQIAVRLIGAFETHQSIYVDLEEGEVVRIDGVRHVENGDGTYPHVALKLIAARINGKVRWVARYFGDSPWDGTDERVITSDGQTVKEYCNGESTVLEAAKSVGLNEDFIVVATPRRVELVDSDVVLKRLGL